MTARDRWRGVLDTIRLGHPTARALAVADSRSLVRSLWLSSADRLDILAPLAAGLTEAEIAARLGTTRPERLEAWLAVGVELGELRRRDDRYELKGRRARAVAAGDATLVAHYRSMLGYQVGPYGELADLFHAAPGAGRADLDDQADDIAQVSLAAAPFVSRWLAGVIAERRPAAVLDVGCGTGIYSAVVLGADPGVRVTAIDLAGSVVAAARARLDAAGLTRRAELHTGDVRTWAEGQAARFDVVLLINNIYYFDPATRVALYRDLGGLLAPGGELVVVTMTRPGSIAAAHLHFMLVAQAGTNALPTVAAIDADLRAAGFAEITTDRLVPTEPLRAVRARHPPGTAMPERPPG